MINPKHFFEETKKLGINFFTGVPDSLLKHLCYFISDNVENENHIISANEGNSIALACGHFISSGKPAFVYMQNSGFGNSINPITSIADNEVYGIPMIIMIGWRGEPGVKDEPQHIKQGRISKDLLKVLDIPFHILGPESDFKKILNDSYHEAVKKNCPVVLLTQKNTFSKYLPTFSQYEEPLSNLTRENSIKAIVMNSMKEDIFISTTGVASRELFEIRESLGQEHNKDFLTVGGMGHTGSIALGAALANKNQRILCLDGDGSALMHMGSLAIIGSQNATNLIYILLNNGVHDSVGGQPTVGSKINFLQIAEACNFSYIRQINNQNELDFQLSEINNRTQNESIFIEIRLKSGFRSDLGRPTQTPKKNISLLMENIRDSKNN